MRARKLGLLIAPFAVALAIGCGLKTIGERPVDPSTDASPDTYVEPFPDVRYEASPGDDGGSDGGLDAPWVPSNLPGVPDLDAGDAALTITSATIDTTTATVTVGTLDGEYALAASADGKLNGATTAQTPYGRRTLSVASVGLMRARERR